MHVLQEKVTQVLDDELFACTEYLTLGCWSLSWQGMVSIVHKQAPAGRLGEKGATSCTFNVPMTVYTKLSNQKYD